MGWMPRGASWLRTILLVLIAVATGFLLTGLNNSPKTVYFASQNPSLFLIILAVVILIPCITYAYIHCWLLGNKPDGWAKKIPSPLSIKEAALTYVVTYFGLLITLLITSPFAPDFSRYGVYRYREELERFYYGVSFSWFVVSLYMFHAYDLISNPQARKSVDKAKSETANNKINSVDRDLVNLKNKTGIHFKEPPKQ
jgi:H+/Cl- antiporter ClcA